MAAIGQRSLGDPRQALPFFLSLGLVPLAVLAIYRGGFWIACLPIYTWVLFTFLDAALGANEENLDPQSPSPQLALYKLLTVIWFPLQFVLLCLFLYHVPRSDLSVTETLGLCFGFGVMTGTIGINYAHELMHQKSKLERWSADLLLASVLYSHFRSEHLRVHHLYVGTPRDAVTARYNEGFHRYWWRVMRRCLPSAFQAERRLLARRDLPWWHRSNPFWRYWVLQAGFLILALVLGGWQGVGLFCGQAVVAIWQLELVNYVEHYGLTRRYLGDGRYEHALPRHSWNAAHKASNWLLINLQRHSDHHYKPDRAFPLLQNYTEEEAPQLPFGYPVMAAIAMMPPIWRRYMNPKVRAWRRQFYPDITDWQAYNKAKNPMPKGSV